MATSSVRSEFVTTRLEIRRGPAHASSASRSTSTNQAASALGVERGVSIDKHYSVAVYDGGRANSGCRNRGGKGGRELRARRFRRPGGPRLPTARRHGKPPGPPRRETGGGGGGPPAPRG